MTISNIDVKLQGYTATFGITSLTLDMSKYWRVIPKYRSDIIPAFGVSYKSIRISSHIAIKRNRIIVFIDLIIVICISKKIFYFKN